MSHPCPPAVPPPTTLCSHARLKPLSHLASACALIRPGSFGSTLMCCLLSTALLFLLGLLTSLLLLLLTAAPLLLLNPCSLALLLAQSQGWAQGPCHAFAPMGDGTRLSARCAGPASCCSVPSLPKQNRGQQRAFIVLAASVLFHLYIPSFQALLPLLLHHLLL